MKNVFFLFALLCAFFSSCSDEDGANVTTSNVKLPHVVTINSGDKVTCSSNTKSQVKVLAFDNEEDFNHFVGILRTKTSQQRAQLVKSLGFESLAMINDKADKELDKIGATASSVDDFRAKYLDYKTKYAGILVANAADSTDLSLYKPASKDTAVAPYLVGECNKVLVDGALRDIPFSDEMNDDDKKIFATSYTEYSPNSTRSVEKDYTSEDSWPVNGFIEKDGNHKTICSVYVTDEFKLFIHFGAQYKMWYGWKRANRQFFFRLENMEGLDKLNPDALSSNLSPNTYYFGTSKEFYSYTKIDFHVAEVTQNPIVMTNKYEVTGKVFVWTDRMSEKDANGNVIYQSTGSSIYPTQHAPRENFPLFKKENSFPCKISLVGKR